MLVNTEIEYQDDDTLCRGFIAYDNALPLCKPCVMIAHDWSGRGTAFCKKAEQLAAQGYVGFAIDMYGEAKLGRTDEEKRALLYPIMNDRMRVLSRILAAYNTAATLSWVDPTRITAIGYCFGGLCVLDLARSNANVRGVVSFHGLLSAPDTLCAEIRAKILILHGYDDPLVPPEHIHQFAQEMTIKKADWQIHMYGHTQHSFTNPQAHHAASGLQYNEQADQRSWSSAESFLREITQK